MVVEQKSDYFSIASTINQTPFEESTRQRFFQTWCEKNDSLTPTFLTDRDWQKRKITRLIERQPDGRNILYIPCDIRLWEMAIAVGWIDNETFAEQRGLAQKATHELEKFGRMFSRTGIYLSKRLGKIEYGQEIAREFAQKFYFYGEKLRGEDVSEDVSVEQIANQELTDEETQDVDRWIAGEKVYSSRLRRAQKEISQNPEQEMEIQERYRLAALNQFFRVTGDDAPSAFVQRAKEHIAWAIETPKRELTSAIFRHGIEKLVQELRPTWFGNRWESILKLYANDILHLVRQGEFQPQTLTYELNLTNLRRGLARARKSRNPEKIAKKELETAMKIQQAVTAFPYLLRADTPQAIIDEQKLNCLGATILGGALMRKLGISYLPVALPGHAIVFLITSDEKVYWYDLRDQKFNARLIDDETDEPDTKDEKTIADIIEFSKHPTTEGLKLDLSSQSMRQHFPWLDPEDKRVAFLLPPQFGEELMVLGNTAHLLTVLDRYEEAAEMYKEAIAKNPGLPFFYADLSDALFKLRKNEESIQIIKKGSVLKPDDAYLYDMLGVRYDAQNDFNQAEILFRKAIELDPRVSGFYKNLLEILLKQGRTQEALEVFTLARSVELFEMGNAIYKRTRFGDQLAPEHALLYYKGAIRADASFIYSYFGLGRSFQQLGYHEKAVGAYTKFLELANPEKDKEWIDLTKIALELLTATVYTPGVY